MWTNRRSALAFLCSMAGTKALPGWVAHSQRPPNFIIILCDDLGYGDIQPTGGHLIPTPQLNRMAREGMVLTDYYAPQNLCTPSRAGLLTGRYPIRSGLAWGVILQPDRRILPMTEVTIPAALRPAGYASGLFGKWHLGHQGPDWQPTKHGFDYFFGIPYSHDMQPLPLFTDTGPDTKPTEEAPVMSELQQRFYGEAEQFIETHKDRPFFVELALSAPHLANYPNARYRDPKMQSAYAEVVEEIDTIVGRLLDKLRQLRLERDTLVIFTSDNGPWYEGSSGVLRDRKGGAGYDGGYRVPCLAWQPGTVPAGKRGDSIAMGIDFLPTFCAMAGQTLPESTLLDGKDIRAVLTQGSPTPHDALLLFDDEEVAAIRTQRWKYVAQTHFHGKRLAIDDHYPQLYDVSVDPGENYSVHHRYPEVLAAMQQHLAQARSTFGPLKRGIPGFGRPQELNVPPKA
ncbi:sulfatase [Comamonas sp. GB3 AK4-5]|uniref:sulfatase family protein n=1 Tax=Comamonas sp. GB3 AK4-5 TaxID=3231487 RepID=UPI00351EE4F4